LITWRKERLATTEEAYLKPKREPPPPKKVIPDT